MPHYVLQDPLQPKVFFYDFKYLKHLRLEQLCNYESMHHSFPSAYLIQGHGAAGVYPSKRKIPLKYTNEQQLEQAPCLDENLVSSPFNSEGLHIMP